MRQTVYPYCIRQKVAMEEYQSMLARMKELSVQAANGTNYR